MRSRFMPVVALLLLPLAGCTWFNDKILKRDKGVAASGERPTKEALVRYVNRQAGELHSLQVNNLAIEAKRGLGVVQSIQLNGTLQAEQPRNFRLEGYLPAAKTDLVDIGSNDREFWFWVGEMGRSNDSQYLYHCSHTDLPKARLPVPIHPDWIMEAIGMAPIAPNANVRMEARDGRTYELIESTVSPQGQRMSKVTVFNARNVSGNEPQIIARKLLDSNGKVICVAEIREMQQDPRYHLNVPRRIDLTYPSDRKMEQISLSLVMDTIAVNAPVDPAMASVWFNRPQKPGVPALDLGRQASGEASFRNPPPGNPGGGAGPGLFRGSRR